MTKQDAIACGAKLYTSGRKCRKHPDSPRRVSNGRCNRCICEYVGRRRKAIKRGTWKPIAKREAISAMANEGK